jgi:hypothetical protein
MRKVYVMTFAACWAGHATTMALAALIVAGLMMTSPEGSLFGESVWIKTGVLWAGGTFLLAPFLVKTMLARPDWCTTDDEYRHHLRCMQEMSMPIGVALGRRWVAKGLRLFRNSARLLLA